MTAAFEEDEPWALEDQDSIQAGQEPEDTAEPASVTAANAEVALGAKVTTLMPPEGIQPRIILYSTHSNESFRKVEGDNYEESSQWRTLDSGYNSKDCTEFGLPYAMNTIACDVRQYRS